jgi:hypothetical protein
MIAAHVAGIPVEELLLAAMPALGVATTALGARYSPWRRIASRRTPKAGLRE